MHWLLMYEIMSETLLPLSLQVLGLSTLTIPWPTTCQACVLFRIPGKGCGNLTMGLAARESLNGLGESLCAASPV